MFEFIHVHASVRLLQLRNILTLKKVQVNHNQLDGIYLYMCYRINKECKSFAFSLRSLIIAQLYIYIYILHYHVNYKNNKQGFSKPGLEIMQTGTLLKGLVSLFVHWPSLGILPESPTEHSAFHWHHNTHVQQQPPPPTQRNKYAHWTIICLTVHRIRLGKARCNNSCLVTDLSHNCGSAKASTQNWSWHLRRRATYNGDSKLILRG